MTRLQTRVEETWLGTAAWVGLALLIGCSPAARAEAPGAVAKPAAAAPHAIRIAVFDFDVPKDVDVAPGALTDQINVLLAAMPKVTIVDRTQIRKVADEHKMALAGLVEADTAVQLGKFLSAQYVAVGRASRIGEENYLVLKVIDVETTVQTTVSAKSRAARGIAALVRQLGSALGPKIRELQAPVAAVPDAAMARLRQAAQPLVGKRVLLRIEETHVNRPLRDPAAQMAVASRLRGLGVEVVVPAELADTWRQTLLETGTYRGKKVDFLLEGEGTSAFAAEIQGLISCRARVELRLIPLPGREVAVAEKGVGAKVDLVEALAAKAALEDAATNAVDALITKIPRPDPNRQRQILEDSGGDLARDLVAMPPPTERVEAYDQ